MNKPASLAVKEFSQNLENCINNSGLPPIIIEIVMRSYYLQIKEMAENQTREEEQKYRQNSEVKENGE